MASFSKLNQEKIKEIMSRYDLEYINSHQIKGGACNSSFLLETNKGKYVLTIFEEQDHDYINRYCRIMVHLDKNNFQTSKVFALKDGGYVSEVFGKPAVLKTYLDGEIDFNLTEDRLEMIGHNLATLHNIETADFFPKVHPHGIQDFYKINDLNLHSDYEIWLEGQVERIASGIDPQLPRSLIHGDLFFDNVLFSNGKIVAIIDFVEACDYYDISDLGMAVVGQCIEDGQISYNKVKALISGYESVRVLEDIEKEAFKNFIEYAAIVISFWRFCRYHVQKTVPEKKDKHMEMVMLSKHIRTIPDQVFTENIFDTKR